MRRSDLDFPHIKQLADLTRITRVNNLHLRPHMGTSSQYEQDVLHPGVQTCTWCVQYAEQGRRCLTICLPGGSVCCWLTALERSLSRVDWFYNDHLPPSLWVLRCNLRVEQRLCYIDHRAFNEKRFSERERLCHWDIQSRINLSMTNWSFCSKRGR